MSRQSELTKSYYAQLIAVSGKKVECGSTFEGTKEMVQIYQFPFKGIILFPIIFAE